jgi:hypothetical protein
MTSAMRRRVSASAINPKTHGSLLTIWQPWSPGWSVFVLTPETRARVEKLAPKPLFVQQAG